MINRNHLPLAVYYEHPEWFRPLFAELDRRSIQYVRIDAGDHIAGPGRLSLNVVSSWWADEAKKYGVHFERHDDRYARTAEWLEIVDQLWKRDHFSFSGSYYQIEDSILRPKPISQPRPLIYAGGNRKRREN